MFWKKKDELVKCFACNGTTTADCLTEHYTACYQMHVLQGLAKGLANGTSGLSPNAVRAAQGYPKAHSSGSAIEDPTFSNSGEVRSTSSTGGMKGVKAERHSLIPKPALDALARCMAKGALKYSDHNWRKGYEFSKSLDSALRHLLSYIDGEDDDPEIGESHLAAVMFHCSVLITLMETHPEFDDRYKAPESASSKLYKENLDALAKFGGIDIGKPFTNDEVYRRNKEWLDSQND